MLIDAALLQVVTFAGAQPVRAVDLLVQTCWYAGRADGGGFRYTVSDERRCADRNVHLLTVPSWVRTVSHPFQGLGIGYDMQEFAALLREITFAGAEPVRAVDLAVEDARCCWFVGFVAG